MKYCKWTFDDIDCFYKIECGHSFTFTDGETAKDNHFVFCPYCGKKIKEKIK